MQYNYPPDLPISQRREEILRTLREHPVVIIAGETGSGKTTQLPKMCLEAGWGDRGLVGCTQPRRVAAMSLSKRVAEELQVTWGQEVGCKMRFNDDTSRRTRLKFMTDGILLAEVQSDPMLRQYSAIIIDEAHERSLNIDFLIGYLIRLREKRPELRIIVTSATIDTQAFSVAFGGAPIVEVSGRLYPVELRYWPIDSAPEEDGFVEDTVRAAEDCLMEGQEGDVLVFFPTERDIREARDLLEGRVGRHCEVLPLFGRMSGPDQLRVFSPGGKRRIVLSTNIAETSVTIPRIRYVVDTGTARMSRYDPRTRTKRLPVEGISQSSANQRQGRAGRVQSGVCVRLYTEEDFEKRPKFSQPEIQRANLAEVILRMKAFRLGEIEDFPFLSPPSVSAIRAGYLLLHELGALDEEKELTSIGRDLAWLPVDPTIGRMLLQAREEKCLAEMCVLAAGLSIPDPRERPEEAREAATAAHQAFAHPESDFLGLLKIWLAAPKEGNSRNALRKFCTQNFISMLRFKEWRDIHSQLVDLLADADTDLPLPSLPEDLVTYRAVHRAVVAGLPSHVALKDEKEKNTYKTSGERKVVVFPGSHLHEKPVRKNKTPGKSKQPTWMVSGEIVQTSQLFARTNARIEPQWVIDTAPHLCEYRFRDPQWDDKSERVLATERTILYGLELRRRRVDYGKVDPAKAKEILIRDYLLGEERALHFPWWQKNQALRQKLETALASSRSRKVFGIVEGLYRFYARELPAISSVADLNAAYHERSRQNPGYLLATEADLTGGDDVEWDAEAYPDRVQLDNTVLPLAYAYQPGADQDGVTITVPLPAAPMLTDSQVQWMVPGMRRELVSHLLRALPKNARRQLLPIEEKIEHILTEFKPKAGGFLTELASFLTKRYGVEIAGTDWPADTIPPYLKPRLNVVDSANQSVAVDRDLKKIKVLAEAAKPKTTAWIDMTERYEQRGLLSWRMGDLPPQVEVERIAGVGVYAYPGLEVEAGAVNLRYFREAEQRTRKSPAAIRLLAEHVIARDIAWLQKELSSFQAVVPVDPKSKQGGGLAGALQTWGSQQSSGKPVTSWCPPDVLQASALEHLCAHVLRLEPLLPLTAGRFEEMLANAKKQLPLLAAKMREHCATIFRLREGLIASPKQYASMHEDLVRLLPADFLAKTPNRQLIHIPRYLRSMAVRAERAALHPAKDLEKSDRLDPFYGWREHVPAAKAEEFFWMLEEYRVSIFSPELGTAQPVSEKRLLGFME